MKIYENIKNIYTKIKEKKKFKLIADIMVCLMLTLACTTAFASNYTFGYSVILSGKVIGNVYSKSDVEGAVKKINEQYKAYFGGEDAIYDEPLYSLSVFKKDEITSEKDVTENIKASSGQMTKQFVIVVDGVDAAGLKSEKEAEKVLNDYKSKFIEDEKNETAEFKNDVKIEEKYSPSMLFVSADGAMSIISGEAGFSYAPSIEVSVAKYETVESEIPFETSKKEDANVYEGVEKVETKGENGIKETVIKTVKINGDVVSEEVVSENIEKEPVTQVLKVGTKERPAGVGTGQFSLPYSGTITSRFGTRWSRQHSGVDISGAVGSAVYAADDGVVEFAGWDSSGYGNLVKINHNNGYVTYYAHLNSINVTKGEPVKKGDVIAALGNTGRSTGPHVHFEVRVNGSPIDPLSCAE